MLPLILPEPIGPAAHYASQFLGYLARRGHRSAACVGWQADQVALVGPKSGGCGERADGVQVGQVQRADLGIVPDLAGRPLSLGLVPNAMITSAPALARTRAAARPMPLLPPVITIRRPC
jgi:hypothetical protein